MRYWAQLNENNVVLCVTVSDGNDADGGYGWLIENIGGRWIETTVDGSIIKNFAQTGDLYDESRNAFVRPKPYGSWILNESTCLWEPPVLYPQDGKSYYWDESVINWVELNV